MITVISGTNRRNSATRMVAEHCQGILQARTEEEVQLLKLEEIAHDWFFPEMYEADGQAASLVGLQDQFILPAKKFLVVAPEYNGSIPGVLKLFLDACSVRAYAANFRGKKAAFVGIASGRAGNLRGLDHLTSVFHHVGTVVMPRQLPLSSIETLLMNGALQDVATLDTMTTFLEEFLTF